jgi:YVTN family beta-propeller protein
MRVTNNGGGLGNTVSVLRASDGAHVMTPTVGFYPAGVAFDGTNMWVANYLDNTVSVLRASDGALSKTIPVSPGPFGLAFDGTNMWVTNYSSGGIPANTVSVLRISDGTQIMTPTVGSGPQKLVFDGTNMWVTNDFSNDVSVLRASDGSPVGTVPVGFRPYGIAFDGTNIWVVNYNDNNVSVLRASDGSFVTTVPVGVHPAHITFDGTHMWIGNGDSNTVSKRPIASYHSTIEQTITVPPTLTFGTLSLVYQIAEADPVSDTLSVSLVGPTETLAYSLPLTSSGWTHQWWDVSTWTAPTATVRIEFTHGDYPGSSSAVFDDISWGSSNKGGEIVYLPVIYR